MKLLLNLSFFLIGITQPLLSQNTINGRITDQQNVGIPYANVLVLNTSDSLLVKGSVADQDGNYQLTNVSKGSYLIQSFTIGYSKSYSSKIIYNGDKTLTIPDIILAEDTKELEEVVIKAEKPLYEQTIDRMVINVQSSPLLVGSSVLEILESSPGVMVDRLNSGINMNGKNGVSVMINGKMSRMDMASLFALLDGMPSNNIDKIELITTPPANFDAEGNAGFINIVLRRNDLEGTIGSMTAAVGKGRRGMWMIGGNINYRKKKISIFTDLSYTRRYKNMIFGGGSDIENDNYTYSSTYVADRMNVAPLFNGRAGLDYYITPKTVIGILGTASERKWSQNTINTAYYTIDPGLDTLVNGTRIDRNPTKLYMANVNLQHSFNSQQINFDIDYFKWSNDQFQNYLNNFSLEDGQFIERQELSIDKISPFNLWVGKLDYKNNVNDKVTFETGIKATLNGLDNDVAAQRLTDTGWQNDPLVSQYSTMDEDIFAAYSSLGLKINEKVSMKLGFRYEHTKTDIRDQNNNQVVYRNYGYLFPSAFLSKKLTATSSLNLAYSYRITRPSFSELAPFIIFIDANSFGTGNPNLLPSLTNAIKASYSVKKINVSLEYSKVDDLIARRQLSRVPDTNIQVRASTNIEQTDLISFALSFPVYLSDWWEMNNNVSLRNSRTRTTYFEEDMDLSQSNYSINSIQSFILPKQFRLEVRGVYNSKRLRGVMTMEEYGTVSFGVRKELAEERGSLNLSFANIIGSRAFRMSSQLPQFKMSGTGFFDVDLRSIKMTYSRKFGNTKLKSRSKRKTGSDDDLKRVG